MLWLKEEEMKLCNGSNITTKCALQTCISRNYLWKTVYIYLIYIFICSQRKILELGTAKVPHLQNIFFFMHSMKEQFRVACIVIPLHCGHVTSNYMF